MNLPRTAIVRSFAPFIFVFFSGAHASAQEVVTIFFDNGGDEAGITRSGTTEFSFKGSSWSGGGVATERILPLYASGSFSYEITGDGEVAFDSPVDSVEFFYVHGFGFSAGTARAFDAEGAELGSVESKMASTFGDMENFVTLDPEAPLSRIEFSAGVIDNFSYTLSPAPEPSILPGDITLELEEVASGLSSPVLLTHAADGSGRLFVVDQAGAVRVIKEESLLERPFLDLGGKIVELDPAFDERGLLGLAFHPDFETNGRFFVRYSAPREDDPDDPCAGRRRGCHKEVLAEYPGAEDDPDLADPDSERILFEIDEPEFNHDAGHVAFGPDGFLYFSLGDGGGRDDGLSSDPPAHGPIGNGQNLETALGALLRIDVDGGEPFGVPPDNPFVGRDGLDEIYAYGFRNPYRFSFDRGGSNELFLADVGQDLFEEIDVIEAGGNYGWALREGANCFDPENSTDPPSDCPTEGLIDPIAEYDHSEGIAIVGGFIYRGGRFPELVGKYVFGDFSRPTGEGGRLFYLDADGDRSQIFEFQTTEGGPLELFVKGFGEDEEGELYILASEDSGPLGETGVVLRITRPGGPDGGLQLPGDCTQDGNLDISDAICLLGVLFIGDPPRFPCGDGTSRDPGNLALEDWGGDGSVNITDVVTLLQFLFRGGPPHTLAVPGAESVSCVPIFGCPDNARCR